MKKAITTFVWSLLILVPTLAQAQTQNVTGTVIDTDTGEPLAGASVVVVGSTVGTATAVVGKYQISAAADDVLGFSFMSYHIVVVRASYRSEFYIGLTTEFRRIDEVDAGEE